MITIEDIMAMQKGKEAQAQEMAGGMMNQALEQADEQATIEQAEVQAGNEDKLTADAELALQHLSEVPNPEEEFNKLPPVLQNKIMELMNRQGNPDAQQAEPALPPQQDAMVLQGQ